MSSKGNLIEGKPPVLSTMSPPTPKLALNSDLNEFVCGWGAAIVNITITFPLNKIIFRQMLHNVGVSGAIRQMSKEGILFLYRGILPPLCQKSISTSLMFGIYENCRSRLVDLGVPKVTSTFVAANIAGTTEAILAPFERLQTLMQHSQFHSEFKNSQHAIRVIAVNYGIKEFYRGLVPILLRNGPSNLFFFMAREQADAILPKADSLIGSTMKGFVIGAVIGAVGSTVFYPLNVIKVHVQSRLGGPYQSTWGAVREIYYARDGSMRKFYRGVHMNYTRSFISWGIINVAYEKLKELLSQE
ncbi:mitochondrial nicotinamide adenine dinucleotide transporter SLC25A51-like [Macrosteles quadrilineatus]|uniref:mitochondrial nicotinamide adenine dinucleotide transporter SLC25A51-like n=1 Tax=Macrosteles quadrilineatus TaxID=74068 RepID=UPI0023E2537C|nr:mitochondrial nicotinamide adenine dinucleotide transporter SLC25A51-like [Macrosteles quadrilineatus]XP_054270199.1 mitochondrial nicotinamide adenine dinucleotide transporter SLC25A51-like [Macrosteles quadrilineatus]XP_054271603.1 mitochondrial nicotinamide adenine dinucleotide transporter SLC25A51-like [Macrosteles quadrilineatus]